MFGWLFLFFLLSLVLTRLLLLYAEKTGLYDIPNDRSLHLTPTPRGGGLAIVLVVFLVTILLWRYQMISREVMRALMVGSGLLAVVGWQDDRHKSRAHWRLVVHFFVSAWALYWIGGFSEISLGDHQLDLGWFGELLALIGMAWMVNLYNFMDGADGFSSGETLFVGGVGALLLFYEGAEGLALLSGAIAAASAGFLIWNRPPARIFMGDVASGALGFLFALLAILSEKQGVLSFWVWMILISLFVSDATFTLVRRIIRKEAWYSAHRSHSYQQLALQHGHGWLLKYAMLINLLIVLPMALFAWHFSLWAPEVVITTYTLMWFLWRKTQNLPTS